MPCFCGWSVFSLGALVHRWFHPSFSQLVHACPRLFAGCLKWFLYLPPWVWALMFPSLVWWGYPRLLRRCLAVWRLFLSLRSPSTLACLCSLLRIMSPWLTKSVPVLLLHSSPTACSLLAVAPRGARSSVSFNLSWLRPCGGPCAFCLSSRALSVAFGCIALPCWLGC